MGRTIPSFRIALEMEQAEWKPFRDALDKSDRKKFDDMWDIPRWYVSACSYSVQYVRLHPILMCMVFHHYKRLTECISEVEEIEAKLECLAQQEKEIKVELQPPPPARQLKLSEF